MISLEKSMLSGGSEKSMLSEPLFDGAYPALLFAFRYSGQQYSLSVVGKMMGGRGGSGKGLTGLDGAAQAGIIRAEVGQLDPWERDVLIARFSVDRKDAIQAKINLIAVAASALPSGMNSRRLIDALVQRYFGEKMTFEDMALRFGVGKDTIRKDRWSPVMKKLHDIEDRAHLNIYDRLKSACIIC